MNLSGLGFHVWPYLAESPETTDELRLDLDPQPGIGFEEVRALELVATVPFVTSPWHPTAIAVGEGAVWVAVSTP